MVMPKLTKGDYFIQNKFLSILYAKNPEIMKQFIFVSIAILFISERLFTQGSNKYIGGKREHSLA
jgi:hypothetical protein